MVSDRETWLRKTAEEALEPDLPICDAHHHLWDYPDSIPDDQIPVWARRTRHYLLPELLQDMTGGHHVVQTVFLQCSAMYRKSGPVALRCVGETEFVQGIAAQSASGLYGSTAVAAGIVGAADLTLAGEVTGVLEAQVAASPNRFRGIRHISTWDGSKDVYAGLNPPKLLSNNRFREGFACLRRYNLSFDAWLYHTQLMELVDLARSFPDTTIILNHVGGPLGIGPYSGRRAEVLGQWKDGIAALSKCPNAVMKLGGLGMPITGFGWHQRPRPPGSAELAAAFAPYYHWCIERFGADRCMFESNFPVDNVSYSYTVVWNAFKRMSESFSPGEKAALFHDTAARVYRLSGDS